LVKLPIGDFRKNLLLIPFYKLKDTFSLPKAFLMGAIHNKIKKLRESQFTQQEMADAMNLHLKTWQKIENGVTKLDIDRLKQIAEVLGTTAEDLINVDDGVYINEIKDNDVGFNNSLITINHRPEDEKALYERIIQDKDKTISDKDKEIDFLREMISKNKLQEKI
jgi:transcriptional regulator with XRE-family HTH domain